MAPQIGKAADNSAPDRQVAENTAHRKSPGVSQPFPALEATVSCLFYFLRQKITSGKSVLFSSGFEKRGPK